jgi:hypothetical protein
MVDATPRPPAADHCQKFVDDAAEIRVRPTVIRNKIWLEPGRPGVCHRYYLEGGGTVEFYVPSNVAQASLRDYVCLMRSIDSQFRAAAGRNARNLKIRMRRGWPFTRS